VKDEIIDYIDYKVIAGKDKEVS